MVIKYACFIPRIVTEHHDAMAFRQSRLEHAVILGTVSKLHYPVSFSLPLVTPIPFILTPIWVLVGSLHSEKYISYLLLLTTWYI